ncbi:MAG: hypothetical protein ACKOCD_04615 [Nitrospiraceae bacterium]
MQEPLTSRKLTYDESKAAEAAFRGLPCDPHWSEAARAVYDGIRQAAQGRVQIAKPLPDEASVAHQTPAETDGDATTLQPPDETAYVQNQPADGEPATSPFETGLALLKSREDAIQAGLLVDLTPMAKNLGLSLPVDMTKPLWQLAITDSESIPEEQRDARVRDVLMALRLRLATTRMTIPWIEFPALLAFPPESTPQICVLHAVAHGTQSAPLSLTLALREEIAPIITTFHN